MTIYNLFCQYIFVCMLIFYGNSVCIIILPCSSTVMIFIILIMIVCIMHDIEIYSLFLIIIAYSYYHGYYMYCV